jgi:hypothetical protein
MSGKVAPATTPSMSSIGEDGLLDETKSDDGDTVSAFSQEGEDNLTDTRHSQPSRNPPKLGEVHKTKHRSTIRTVIFNEVSKDSKSNVQKPQGACVRCLSASLNSKAYNIFVTLVVVIVLFAEEFVSVACFQVPYIYWGVAAVYQTALVVFILEIILSSIAMRGRDPYFAGFYFWLDILATLSLVVDQPWFPSSFRTTSGSAGETLNLLRLVRVTRMVRLVRIVRLMKAMKRLENGDEDEEGSANYEVPALGRDVGAKAEARAGAGGSRKAMTSSSRAKYSSSGVGNVSVWLRRRASEIQRRFLRARWDH